jgi:hypothetical protein
MENKVDDFPCQSDIEGSDKCGIQCDHCYEYYSPLEVEQAARDWADKFSGDSWKNHLREAFEAGVEWAKANQKNKQ